MSALSTPDSTGAPRRTMACTCARAPSSSHTWGDAWGAASEVGGDRWAVSGGRRAAGRGGRVVSRGRPPHRTAHLAHVERRRALEQVAAEVPDVAARHVLLLEDELDPVERHVLRAHLPQQHGLPVAQMERLCHGSLYGDLESALAGRPVRLRHAQHERLITARERRRRWRPRRALVPCRRVGARRLRRLGKVDLEEVARLQLQLLQQRNAQQQLLLVDLAAVDPQRCALRLNPGRAGEHCAKTRAVYRLGSARRALVVCLGRRSADTRMPFLPKHHS